MSRQWHAGKITISRPHDGTYDNQQMRIELIDAGNSICLGEVRMHLGDFAEALLGLGHVDCEFDLDTSRVGLIAERKTIDVYVPDGPFSERQERARQAVAAYEVDGWQGRISDALNHHRRKTTLAVGGALYSVSFERLVPPAAPNDPA